MMSYYTIRKGNGSPQMSFPQESHGGGRGKAKSWFKPEEELASQEESSCNLENLWNHAVGQTR